MKHKTFMINLLKGNLIRMKRKLRNRKNNLIIFTSIIFSQFYIIFSTLLYFDNLIVLL